MGGLRGGGVDGNQHVRRRGTPTCTGLLLCALCLRYIYGRHRQSDVTLRISDELPEKLGDEKQGWTSPNALAAAAETPGGEQRDINGSVLTQTCQKSIRKQFPESKPPHTLAKPLAQTDALATVAGSACCARRSGFASPATICPLSEALHPHAVIAWRLFTAFLASTRCLPPQLPTCLLESALRTPWRMRAEQYASNLVGWRELPGALSKQACRRRRCSRR